MLHKMKSGMEKPVNMKISAAEKKKMIPSAVQEIGKGPEYPWGLTIDLEDAALKKLGMKDMPEVGTECMIHAVGKVVRVSESASEKNETRSMQIQITKMSIGHEDEDLAKGYDKVKKSY